MCLAAFRPRGSESGDRLADGNSYRGRALIDAGRKQPIAERVLICVSLFFSVCEYYTPKFNYCQPFVAVSFLQTLRTTCT